MTNEERIQNSKNKIYEASLEEFSAKGYAGSSVNNITKAGIPKGLLYHIYKNKDEIYLACVERCYRELMDYIQLDDITLESYIRKRQKFFRNNPKAGKIIFETMHSVSPAVDEKIQEIRKPFDAFNRACFKKILSNVNMRKNISEETAMQYFFMIQNAMNSYFTHEDEEESAWIRHEEALPKVLDLVLYGIADKSDEKKG